MLVLSFISAFASEQFMQVQEQPAQIWNQAQTALQNISTLQMSMKQPQQQQQTFYMSAQDPLKLYEQQQLSSMDKKIKYPEVSMQDFHWDSSYRMGDSLAVMAERMKRPSPGGICGDQEGPVGPRGPPFEVSKEGLHMFVCSVCAAFLSFLLYFLPERTVSGGG